MNQKAGAATTKRKKTRGQKSISLMALEFLYNQGPMTYVDMAELVREQPRCSKYDTKSVHTKLLELETKNLVWRDDKGFWHLRPGVTPQTLLTGELEMVTEEITDTEQEQEGEVTEEEEKPQAGQKPRRPNTQPSTTTGIPLDQREMFIKHMSAIGVAPKEAIPTIADLFFEGDIEDLKWLESVLKRSAAGYVKAHQRRLMIDWWAKTRGLPYNPDEFPLEEEGEEKSKKATGKAEAKEEKPSRPMDPGQGWRVAKDRAGDWCAIPGGPLTYEEALDRAERRATIAAYTSDAGEEEGEPAAEAEPAAATKKGRAAAQPLMETMMLKVLESLLDGGGKKDSVADAKIEALQSQIQAMKDDRMEERFERMEGMVAQALSRDPLAEFQSFQQQAQRFGYGPSVVTDQSPAVQLIKDQSDKIDRNVSRLMGIIERTALRSEEFQPETTRTGQERERKAGELLNVAQGRESSKQLRRETFGV